MALGCVALFGIERGREIRALIEKLTDSVCPCVAGKPCPLLPQASSSRKDSPDMTTWAARAACNCRSGIRCP